MPNCVKLHHFRLISLTFQILSGAVLVYVFCDCSICNFLPMSFPVRRTVALSAGTSSYMILAAISTKQSFLHANVMPYTYKNSYLPYTFWPLSNIFFMKEDTYTHDASNFLQQGSGDIFVRALINSNFFSFFIYVRATFDKTTELKVCCELHLFYKVKYIIKTRRKELNLAGKLTEILQCL